MMGDDMAIRSGGMYGNPESKYTLANPNVGSSWAGGLQTVGSVFKAGAGMFGSLLSYGAQQKQTEMDLQTLQKEKLYNLKNFEQTIADTFAKNKASFYASGLDFTGTALSVARENRRALTEDMRMMEYNYEMQERSLREKQKANKRNLYSNIAGSVLSVF